MKIVITIFCSLLLAACSSTRHQTKPAFFYNGKPYASAIQNPVSKNSRESRDKKTSECVIVQGEMSLYLNSDDGKLFKGLVQDAGSTDTLPYVSVQIQFADSSIEKIMSDMDGIFQFNKHSRIIHLTASFVGYKVLNIDLENSNIIEQ